MSGASDNYCSHYFERIPDSQPFIIVSQLVASPPSGIDVVTGGWFGGAIPYIKFPSTHKNTKSDGILLGPLSWCSLHQK